MIRCVLPLLLSGILCACTIPSQSSDIAPATVVDSPTTTPGTEKAALPTAADTAFTVTELPFAGNGETFLDHIARTVQVVGTPTDHRFITVAGEAGVTWQGELLTFADQTLIFLQAAHTGGTQGIEIKAPPGTTADDLFDTSLPTPPNPVVGSPYPTIAFVRARLTDAGEDTTQWSFDVTMRYPDTGWEDYADGWQIETPDAQILGTRILLHPHVNEQPFTRSLSNVAVPNSVTTVVVRGHDLISGYSPNGVAVPLAEAVVTQDYEVIR